MFHFLGFLFIIIIAVLVIGLSVIGTIFKALFGFGRRSASNPNSGTRTGRTSRQQQQSYTHTQRKTNSDIIEEEEIIENRVRPHHKKVFSKDDGEYVDFEEIK